MISRWLEKLSSIVELITGNFAVILFVVTNFIFLFAVINRNFLKLPIGSGYFEWASITVTWYICMAAVAAAASFQLIKVPTLIVKYIRDVKKRKIPLLFIYTLNLTFALIFVYYGYKITLVGMNRIFPTIGVNLGVSYAALAAMGFGLTIVFVNFLVKFFRGIDLDKYH